MKDIEWNVYTENINRRQIEKYNIFRHGRFVEDVKKIYEEYKDDFDTFSSEIRKSLMYYFWGKCEWEIILSDWPPSDNFDKEKVDVYDQVMINWNVFIKYVWDTLHERKAEENE